MRWAAVLAVFGVVLGAWYMLWLVQRVFFGPLREPKQDQGEPVADLSLPRDQCAGATGRPGVLDWGLSQVLPRSDGTRPRVLHDGGGAGVAGSRRSSCTGPAAAADFIASAGFAGNLAFSPCFAERRASSEAAVCSTISSPLSESSDRAN